MIVAPRPLIVRCQSASAGDGARRLAGSFPPQNRHASFVDWSSLNSVPFVITLATVVSCVWCQFIRTATTKGSGCAKGWRARALKGTQRRRSGLLTPFGGRVLQRFGGGSLPNLSAPAASILSEEFSVKRGRRKEFLTKCSTRWCSK